MQSSFPQDSTAFGVYCRTNLDSNAFALGSTSQFTFRLRNSNLTRIAINSGGFNDVANTSSLGLRMAGRTNSTTVRHIVNGVVTNTITRASTSPVSSSVYFHAANGVSTAANSNELSLYALNLPNFTTNELLDFYEAIQRYQTNVISGGRNV